MPTVTFYKTNMNRSNRAYDEAALTSILTAASSISIDIGNQVIPNTPFAMTYEGDSGQDIMLSGYDYISYDYAGKTWYAFIDNIQPLAVSEGQLFVSHTTDKWAMCVVYFKDTFKLRGNVERAHVNDLTGSGSSYTITLVNTTATAEAPYNKALSRTGRTRLPQCTRNNTSDPFAYCYVHFSNVGTVASVYGDEIHNRNNSTADIFTPQVHPAVTTQASYLDRELGSSVGYTACYVAVKGEWIKEYLPYSLYATSGIIETESTWWLVIPTISSYSGTTLGEFYLQPLSDLTAEGITSITISRIPPFNRPLVSQTLNFAGVFVNGYVCEYSTAYGEDDPTQITLPWYDSGVISYLWLFRDNLTEARIAAKTGYPLFLCCPSYITGVCYNFTSTLSTAAPYANTDTLPPFTSGSYTPASTYSNYITKIPKYCTGVYNPIYVEGNYIAYELLSNGITSDILISLSYDLTMQVIYINSEQYLGDKIFVRSNLTTFTNNAVLDYWTRLNAIQTGIAAQKSRVTTTLNIVNTLASGAVGGARAGSKALSGNYIGAASTLTRTVGSGVSTILTAKYDYQTADNMQQIANYQYNAGETQDGNDIGLSGSLYSSSAVLFDWVSNEANAEVIGLNLHRYGYNTFLPIDEIYANHRRRYFNYFKGADVSCSGLMQDWCDEIAEMFNGGVTLWQSGATVEEYEVCNYQEGVGT